MDIIEETIEITVTNGLGSGTRTYTPEMRGKLFSHSKYGGANYGLVQQDKTPEWFCQACQQRQGSQLPSYMFEFSHNEFIRICSICQALKILKHITTLDEFIKLVRSKREFWE